MSQLKLELQKELNHQGHNLTGDLIRSIDYELVGQNRRILANMIMNDYYVYLEKGVEPGRVPWSGPGGGGTSKYIQALIRFWRLKGLGQQEAKRAAFATANKHKAQGIPVRSGRGVKGSREDRLGFVEKTLDGKESEIADIIETQFGEDLDFILTDMLNDIQEEFNG